MKALWVSLTDTRGKNILVNLNNFYIIEKVDGYTKLRSKEQHVTVKNEIAEIKKKISVSLGVDFF